LGCKLTALAGSDLPWGNTAGEPRVYVYTGESFSADRWFDGVKQGRTFVTNGPMLELTVNGALPGGEVKVAPNGNLRIRARAWAPPAIGSPKRLEVLAHGQVIRSLESRDAGQNELELEFTVRAGTGQWIVARVKSQNGAQAHTSPVYVPDAGKSFLDRGRVPELVAKRLRVLEYIGTKLRDERFTASFAPGEVAKLSQRVDEARERYQQLLKTP
jgi:hypothetical protein